MKAMGLLVNYPDDTAEGLKRAIADHHSLDPREHYRRSRFRRTETRLFPETFMERGDRVVMARPTFSEYGFGCRLMGARIDELPLSEEADFRIDIDALSEMVNERTKAVYLCNPNNPTSKMVPRKRVLELIEDCQKKGALVFLDETLLELSECYDGTTLTAEVPSHDNLFIIKSFTKSFAMPGMRVGYRLGSKELIGYLETARLSWNLGTIEQVVATTLMNEEYSHVKKAVKILETERTRMYDELSRMVDFKVLMPDSYFFFTGIGELGISSKEFRERMLHHGVLVRDCSSFGAPCQGFTRFCVKTAERNDIFLKAFHDSIEEIRTVK